MPCFLHGALIPLVNTVVFFFLGLALVRQTKADFFSGDEFDLYVYRENGSSQVKANVSCGIQLARFGLQDVDEGGIQACVFSAGIVPDDACAPLQRPHPHDPRFIIYSQCRGRMTFALVTRRTARKCPFSERAKNVADAGYDGMIVQNFEDRIFSPSPSSSDDPDIYIFVAPHTCGMGMRRDGPKHGYFALIEPKDGFDISHYLIPFAVVVGICFLILGIFALVKAVQGRRRNARRRLSRRNLRKLPVRKFKKSDPADLCAICLDDYAEGDKLRVLPCKHFYHQVCIDPWLTKNRKICPICKRKVLSSSRFGRRSSSSSESSSDERAPLIPDAHDDPPVEVGNSVFYDERSSEDVEALDLATPGQQPRRTNRLVGRDHPYEGTTTATTTTDDEDEDYSDAELGESLTEAEPSRMGRVGAAVWNGLTTGWGRLTGRAAPLSIRADDIEPSSDSDHLPGSSYSNPNYVPDVVGSSGAATRSRPPPRRQRHPAQNNAEQVVVPAEPAPMTPYSGDMPYTLTGAALHRQRSTTTGRFEPRSMPVVPCSTRRTISSNSTGRSATTLAVDEDDDMIAGRLDDISAGRNSHG